MYARFQDKLREQRKNPETSRAGLKWDNEEDCSLVDKVKDGVNIEDIAKEHQRTSGSIKTRLIVKAIQSMENDNESLEKVASTFNLEESDIEEYQKKKVEREQKQQVNTRRRVNGRYNNNTVITLSTIHALLQQINNKLG